MVRCISLLLLIAPSACSLSVILPIPSLCTYSQRIKPQLATELINRTTLQLHKHRKLPTCARWSRGRLLLALGRLWTRTLQMCEHLVVVSFLRPSSQHQLIEGHFVHQQTRIRRLVQGSAHLVSAIAAGTACTWRSDSCSSCQSGIQSQQHVSKGCARRQQL